MRKASAIVSTTIDASAKLAGPTASVAVEASAPGNPCPRASIDPSLPRAFHQSSRAKLQGSLQLPGVRSGTKPQLQNLSPCSKLHYDHRHLVQLKGAIMRRRVADEVRPAGPARDRALGRCRGSALDRLVPARSWLMFSDLLSSAPCALSRPDAMDPMAADGARRDPQDRGHHWLTLSARRPFMGTPE